MKHTFVWLTTLALALPQLSIAEGKTMTKDEQNVLATIETMTSAFQNKDIASVMATYENSATIVFEPGSPIFEKAVQEQMFAGMASLNPVFEYARGHEVIISEDIAMHIAPWDMTGKSPDGQEVRQSGLSIAVLRRQADGSWKMVIDNPHGGRLLP
ncbi:MAG: ketosteroid isomerase-like protein [Halocynthiibacter sp.]|jgi:ketosteroid isomerase-like protein